jgi:hypothetical protein
MTVEPWEVPDGLWHGSSRCFRGSSAAFAIQVAGCWMTARSCRHLVRAPHRDRLGAPAAGARLRLRDDSLAQATRLAAGGASGRSCTSCCSRNCTPLISSSGSARSPTPATCRRKRGPQDRPQPGRPRPPGQQAPSPRRRRRYPARPDAHRRQPHDVTQLLGAKGLSGGYVYIVGCNDTHFPRDANAITDEEVCCFLVALSRTRKECQLISCDRFGNVRLNTSRFLNWIQAHVDRVTVNAAWFNAN